MKARQSTILVFVAVNLFGVLIQSPDEMSLWRVRFGVLSIACASCAQLRERALHRSCSRQRAHKNVRGHSCCVTGVTKHPVCKANPRPSARRAR